MTSDGMNDSRSSRSRIALTSAVTPAGDTPIATTTPVTDLVPMGTTTRAPTQGACVPGGTRYVNRSRVGMGTATWTNTGFGLAMTLTLLARSLEPGASGLQESAGHLHILPHLALRGGVAQEIRRMKCGNQLCAAVIVDPAAQTRDRVQRSQK